MNCLTTHSTHFIYGYMASDISLRTILIVRKETRCRHIGYSYRLAASVLLYAPSHIQDNTYHGLCYTSRVMSNQYQIEAPPIELWLLCICGNISMKEGLCFICGAQLIPEVVQIIYYSNIRLHSKHISQFWRENTGVR